MKPNPERDEAKARADVLRLIIAQLEQEATTCGPTMRTIRLPDNSAYDSNCPGVWDFAAMNGCVIR